MNQDIKRIRIEEIDWKGLFPSLCLFRSFRMAIHPPKLLVSLLLVVLVYLSGCILDAAWGPRVHPDEIGEYAKRTSTEFASWRNGREEWTNFQLSRQVRLLDTLTVSTNELVSRSDRFSIAMRAVLEHHNARTKSLRELAASRPDEVNRVAYEKRLIEIQEDARAGIRAMRAIMPEGVFAATLRYELDAFERLIDGAISLNFGIAPVIRGEMYDHNSVAGALRDMVVTVPSWLWTSHRIYLILWSLIAWAIWTVFGGALARMCAMHATRDHRISPATAVQFSLRHVGSFAVTPLVPVLLGAVFLAVLWLFGLIFYGIPGVRHASNMVGALIFIVPLLLALVVTLLLVGLVFGCNLFYPSIAVEGTDGFDATSRAYNYVVGRPWHLLIYTMASLVYGAITYIFMGTIIFITLYLVQGVVAAGAGLFVEGSRGGSPFNDVLPPPELGRLTYNIDGWASLNATGSISAVLTMVWVYLFISLLAAYAVSFYFTAQTWIYLLLRRWTDGTDMTEVYEVPAVATATEKTDASGAAPQQIPPQLVPDEVDNPADTQA